MQVKVGAKGKYCPAIVEEICGYISDGLGKMDAAKMAHISHDTFFVWVKEKPEFAEAIKVAEIAHKKWHLKNIQKHGEKNWTASAWTLERKYPDEFGPKQKLEHSGGLAIGLADLVSKSRKERGIFDE